MSTVTKRAFDGALRPVEKAAFWATVGFPLIWGWYLFIDRDEPDWTTTFMLLVVNAAVLYVGHEGA